MVTESIIEKLKERYPLIHPLIFHRSVERAKSDGDLFDILDTFPAELPVVWCENSHRWISTKDLYQAKNFSGDFE